MIPFELIVAVDKDSGIGKGGKLPWHLPGDMKHFKEITTTTKDASKKNVVIMGRKTWESIPEGFRPLPGRINCVLTRNQKLVFPTGVLKAESFKDALSGLSAPPLKGTYEKVFVIGGAEVFKEAIFLPDCRRIHLTEILSSFDCDTFFPSIPQGFKKGLSSPHQQSREIEYFFTEYARPN